MYAELNNTSMDHCAKCGFEGEIKLEKEDGKLFWKCPKCGNTDKNFMAIWRRICGYLGGANNMNQGRLGEFKDRKEHFA
jgi:ribonucleoside-triphosphate reductase